MGRVTVLALVCVAVLGLTSVDALAAGAAPRSGIRGHVGMDGACLMPGTVCDSQAVPVTIQVERVRSGRVVRTVHCRTGRFRIRLRPGRYRLRATADSGNGAGSARVRVRRHRFTAVVISLHAPAA
jgi:hypothetical protein